MAYLQNIWNEILNIIAYLDVHLTVFSLLFFLVLTAVFYYKKEIAWFYVAAIAAIVNLLMIG